jgi:hypothetical protein
MQVVKRRRLPLAYAMSALILWCYSSANPLILAQDGQSGYVRLVRNIKTRKLGFPNPAGLAFSSSANAFIVLEADSGGASRKNAGSLILMSPLKDLLGTVSLADSAVNPANMVFDSNEQRLLLLDSSSNQLLEIKAGPDGVPEPTVLTRFDAQPFALQDPRGMTIDSNGNLFILDGGAKSIVRVTPGNDKGFDGKAAAQEGRISHVNLGNAGLGNVRALAFNPANGNLFLLSPGRETLYEVALSGAIVSTRDLKDEVKLWDPQSMVFAPSGDQTDDPGQLSLYIADSGPSLQARHGKIVELSLTQTVQMDVSAVTQQTSLVRFTSTAAWWPPSTDPSDIVYLPDSKHLLISDAEVEESPPGSTCPNGQAAQFWWRGYNLFETDLAGNLLHTATTTLDGACTSKVPSPPADGSYTTPYNFSNEPCGMAFRKLQDGSNHLLISDDDDMRVYHVDLGLGSDDLYSDGGNNSVNVLFKTTPCSSSDPEGLTVDTWRNHILLLDGLSAEVYDIDPGPNGTFDGCAGDDVVTHFDTSVIPGLSDPEGIVFDPETGHIFVTGHDTLINRSVVELDPVTREVFRSFHIPEAQTPAGVTIGPGSVDPNVKSLYIVDRAVDNDSSPYENDGKMFEISLSPTPLDTIFADGFESGDISAWCYNSPTGNGLLSVSAAAAMGGTTKGLQVTINDNTSLYVDDEWPDAESHYRARFYFNPNSIAMTSGDTHYIFQGYMVTSTNAPAIMRIEFRFYSGNYQLRGGVVNDAGSFTSTSWSTISNGPHHIGLEWQAATADGANDGYLKLSIDDAPVGSLTGVDNDTRRMDRACMGAVSGIDTGTRGTYYFDEFESYRVPAVNHPPVANDQSVTTAQDAPQAITLTASDPDGDTLTYSVVTGPTHGALSGAAPNLTYTPVPSYNGPDSFTFKANDGTVDSNVAMVSITVTPPPVPTVSSLSPSSLTAGLGDFLLTVTGSGFVSYSVVRWNGVDRPTSFVSSTQLTATISASDIAVGMLVPVTVYTAPPGGGTSSAKTFTVNNPLPATTGLSPATAIAKGSAFTLTVTGSNFVSSSVVRWNGFSRTTTFIDSGHLTAAIKASDISTAQTVPVTVYNPTPGGGVSNAQTFTVTNSAPAITSLSPTTAYARGAAFTLTVNGTGFAATSIIRWNGIDHATTYSSSTRLRATISTADLATAGPVPVTVFTPEPGGGTSNTQTFTVNNPPVPSIKSLSPSSGTAGGADFTLTVTGSGFVTDSKVLWNGVEHATTFVSSTSLTASIPAADIAKAGTATVTVFTPGPGGGTSTAKTFTIKSH